MSQNNFGLKRAVPVLALALLALPAAAQQAPTREVVFAKMPGRYKAYGPPGPYFPERAERMNQNGYGVIDCRVLAQGVLDACTAVSETPDGFGFKEAAVRLAQERLITATGQPTEGRETVRLAVPFQLRYRGEPLAPLTGY